MIRIHVGCQVDGFTFVLSPLDKYKMVDGALVLNYPNAASTIFIGVERGYDGPEVFADRWLILASMLTGMSEDEVEEEGFEMVQMPEDRTLSVPPGVEFLRAG